MQREVLPLQPLSQPFCRHKEATVARVDSYTSVCSHLNLLPGQVVCTSLSETVLALAAVEFMSISTKGWARWESELSPYCPHRGSQYMITATLDLDFSRSMGGPVKLWLRDTRADIADMVKVGAESSANNRIALQACTMGERWQTEYAHRWTAPEEQYSVMCLPLGRLQFHIPCSGRSETQLWNKSGGLYS